MIATSEQIRYVAQHMRDDDYAEISADSHITSREKIAEVSASLPGVAHVVCHKGVPTAVGGLAVNEPGIAQAWLFGTTHVNKCKLEVSHIFRKLIAEAHEQGLEVQARSAAFHTRAHRWLKNFGFTQSDVLRGYGMNGEDFYVFSIRKE